MDGAAADHHQTEEEPGRDPRRRGPLRNQRLGSIRNPLLDDQFSFEAATPNIFVRPRLRTARTPPAGRELMNHEPPPSQETPIHVQITIPSDVVEAIAQRAAEIVIAT